jgi:hypothetical protein
MARKQKKSVSDLLQHTICDQEEKEVEKEANRSRSHSGVSRQDAGKASLSGLLKKIGQAIDKFNKRITSAKVLEKS